MEDVCRLLFNFWYTPKIMLRVIQNANSDSAKSYYAQGLSKEDYYSQSQEIIGQWGGIGSAFLKLNGDVTKNDFNALCENINPHTKEQLTQRNKTNRSVGYDLNFHCPKSVSVLYSLTEGRTAHLVENPHRI